jgi:hypothetical protein
VHTLHSDGEYTPQQVVQRALANGYNAIVVSDHNTVEGSLLAQQYVQQSGVEMIVIPGQEYSTCRIHMNILGIRDTIKPDKPFPTDQELREVVDRVHRLGGLVVANHPFWSNHTVFPHCQSTLPTHPTHSTLVDVIGVDGLEVVNESTLDARTYQYALDKVFTIAGSDLHGPAVAYSWTLLYAASFTEQGILDELRGKRSTFLVDNGGTRHQGIPTETWTYSLLRPLVGWTSLFNDYYSINKGMYSFQGSFCHPLIIQVNWISLISLFTWTLFALVVYDHFIPLAFSYSHGWRT